MTSFTETPGTQITLEQIFQAICDTRTTLEAQVRGVGDEVGLLRRDLRRIAEQVTESETRIATAEDSVQNYLQMSPV